MLDYLYEDIGEKIKGWAKWIFIIETVAAVISGVGLILNDDAPWGVFVLICGPVVAWVGSWILYAFGELVEKTVANESHTKAILAAIKKEKTQAEKLPKAETPKEPEYLICEGCENKITHYPCKHCGHQVEKKDAPYRCGRCGRNGPYVGSCPNCGSSIKFYNN